MVAFIPILLAAAALGGGLAQGISSVKNAQAEAQSTKETAEDEISERARQAKKLMQQQKTSFLKSGVYFNTGSPTQVINETYDTMTDDINAIADDANTTIKNLNRQGKTAFYTSLLQGITSAALSYFSAGTGSAASGSSSSSSLTGGFGSLPSSNGWTGGATKIA